MLLKYASSRQALLDSRFLDENEFTERAVASMERLHLTQVLTQVNVKVDHWDRGKLNPSRRHLDPKPLSYFDIFGIKDRTVQAGMQITACIPAAGHRTA